MPGDRELQVFSNLLILFASTWVRQNRRSDFGRAPRPQGEGQDGPSLSHPLRHFYLPRFPAFRTLGAMFPVANPVAKLAIGRRQPYRPPPI
jgi:hypothetical protein